MTLAGLAATPPIVAEQAKTKSQQGPVQSPLCGSGIKDPRTKLLGEYYSNPVGWQPTCDQFRQDLPAASHYAFGSSRQGNSWNVSNSYDWAVLSSDVVTNLECILNAFGSFPPLNSGFRSPGDQLRISGQPKKWKNALHVQGLAADIDAPNNADWDDLKALAKSGTCGVACVEDRDISPAHFHVDYRPAAQCPAGW